MPKPVCRCPAAWNGINPPPCPRHNPPVKTKALKERIKFLACVALCGALVACDGNINLFGSPTQVQGPSATPTPAASPSPSPSPSLAPTPDPCLIKAVRVSFAGGTAAQLPFVALGAAERLDATPLNDSGAVPDGCNVLREPVWGILTPITCQIVGGGYNPFLRGLRVGACTLTATVSNVVSAPFTVEIR